MAETRKKSHEGDDDDWISKLPDELLARILSHVSTNHAVTTSVLSKRWKLVWASVPNLEFYYSSSSVYDDDRYELEACLGNLVDRVLSLNNVRSVRNVRLHCYHSDAKRVAPWFKSFALRKAEKWDLLLPYSFRDRNIPPNANLLSAGFFSQVSLVELDLTNVVLRVPTGVCFPRLKAVTFSFVQLCGGLDEPMRNLLSGCPAITDLTMSSDVRFRCKRLYVCSSTLQNIKMQAFCDEIVIDTPNVKHLVLDIQTATRVPGSGISPLVTIGTLHNLTHIMLSGIESIEEMAYWLHVLTHTPNGVSIIFHLASPSYPDTWTRSLNLPRSIISRIKYVKITERMIICYLYSATGLKKLIFHGFPVVRDASEDEFLNKFLPASNEWKRNKDFIPSTTEKL